MSDSNKDVKFLLKALINKQKTKVVFAEIDSDLTDVLLGFLTLPLGKIVQILKKHYGDEAPVFGSLTTLYDGLSTLNGAHFSAEGCKQMLLNPASSFANECHRLKLDIGDTQPIKYFSCEDWNCPYRYIGMYHGTARCDCGELLKREIPGRNASEVVSEVFTKSMSTSILFDDLEIVFNVNPSLRQIVSSNALVNVDLDGTELRTVTFGFNEIMELLRSSLLADHFPLTEIILKNQTKYEPVPVQIENREASTDEGFMINAILQKSTNKLLFVEAEENFVEFLFSLLAIPLGKVESLLCGNTCMKGVDSLYGSIACPVKGAYLRNAERSRLINPTIPHGYGSKRHIFSLVEETSPWLSLERDASKKEEYLFPKFSEYPKLKTPKGEKYYLNEPRRYMVKDDLTVTTLCVTSYISIVTEQQIPLADVDGKMLKIGLQEASGILKASLTSTCALSKGLNHLLMKQPKQVKNVKQEY